MMLARVPMNDDTGENDRRHRAGDRRRQHRRQRRIERRQPRATAGDERQQPEQAAEGKGQRPPPASRPRTAPRRRRRSRQRPGRGHRRPVARRFPKRCALELGQALAHVELAGLRRAASLRPASSACRGSPLPARPGPGSSPAAPSGPSEAKIDVGVTRYCASILERAAHDLERLFEPVRWRAIGVERPRQAHQKGCGVLRFGRRHGRRVSLLRSGSTPPGCLEGCTDLRVLHLRMPRHLWQNNPGARGSESQDHPTQRDQEAFARSAKGS